MIPEEFKHRIIADSTNLIRSISQAYGAEDGMQLWDTISQVLDPDIKGEIFMSLLGGESNNNCNMLLKGVQKGVILAHKVQVIKTIREYTGMSLLEAKNISDDLGLGNDVTITLPHDERRKATFAFHALGILGIEV